METQFIRVFLLLFEKLLIFKYRCPFCKKGRLFQGYLRVVNACSECGKEFSKADIGDGASWIVILIVGTIVTGGALKLEQHYNPPYAIHLLIWIPIVFIFTLVLLPLFKAFLISLYFRKEDIEQ